MDPLTVAAYTSGFAAAMLTVGIAVVEIIEQWQEGQ